MRTPDQDERPEAGAADRPLGDGFGSAELADLNDGFGSGFYDDSYDSTDADDVDDIDDTFEDAVTDDGGFGSTGGGSGPGDGVGVGEVVPVGSEVTDAEAENILVEILDDIFGDDADDVLDDMESTTGMDASEILETLDHAYDVEHLDHVDQVDHVDHADDGGGVLDSPFDAFDGG